MRGFDAMAQRDVLASRCQQMTPTVRLDIVLVLFEGNVVVVAMVPEMLPRDKPCHVTARDVIRAATCGPATGT